MTSKMCRKTPLIYACASQAKAQLFSLNVTAVLCWNLSNAFITKQRTIYKHMRLDKSTVWKKHKHSRLKQHRKSTISTAPLTVMFRASSTKDVMLWLQEISDKLIRLNWELTHSIVATARSAERLKILMKNIGLEKNKLFWAKSIKQP